MPRDDDDVWRSIVDNYGDRVELDPDPQDRGSSRGAADFPPAPTDGPDGPDELDGPDGGDDRYVPPAPPPVPTTTADRYAAWAGVFGAPALLLASVVLGIDLPDLLGYALIAAFVGGFCYLVMRMPREPRDPGDDGARL